MQDRINDLKNLISKDRCATSVNDIWIYEKRCLVYDYVINNYQISIDICVYSEGWEIQLFGRNDESFDFLMNTMCANDKFLGKNIDEFEIREKRIIFADRHLDDITGVADCLINLLKRIEDYIRSK